MAVGSTVGGPALGPGARRACACSLVALAGFTVSTALLATAPTFVLFAIYLVPTGLAALTALTTANAMVQVSVDPVMRGRVMALYMAIFVGGTPFGAPVIGWIGDSGARAGRSPSARSWSASASSWWPSGSRAGTMWR